MTTIWDIFKNEYLFIQSLRERKDKEFFLSFHPKMQISILQWLLWYVSSGVKTFTFVKHGNYSRKDWAFHKIKLMHDNLPRETWKAIVNLSTGFSDKCKTIHFFTRNAYSVDKEQLDMINIWFDEVNGRFAYSHLPDEYGYTPEEYVNFHRKRQEIFRKKAKPKIDHIVKQYRILEYDLRDYMQVNYEEMLQLGNVDIFIEDANIRKKIVDITKLRIESHLIHENIFKDELSMIEKNEEAANRGLSQRTNHLWMIRAYRKIIKGTPEGLILENFIKIKKADL